MAKGFSPKAVIYARVSTNEQGVSGISIDNQIETLKQYCVQKGLEVVEIVVDRGVSAGKHLASREGGSKLLDLIQSKKAHHVVGLKLDRLFRNAGDALSTIEKWDKLGISTHLKDFMNGSELDTSSPMGRMVLGISSVFAQFERDLGSQRTKDALQHKKKSKQAYCRGVFGYVRKGTEMVEDKTEQAVISTIKAMREAGKSLRKIANHLMEQGIPTKRGGTKWYASTVKAIVENDIHEKVA